jgi:hypothetical protein
VSWTPSNLRLLGDRPIVKPSVGGVGLIYPGKRHVFSGTQEAAKTMAAYAVALATVRDEGRVLVADLEMGPYDARDRFRDLGATDSDFDRIFYIEPETPPSEKTFQILVDQFPVELAIIDAAAGAYALSDLDDNKRRDVEVWTNHWVRPLWQREVATIVIDHVVKNAENRGKYTIGSERKAGGVDVHLGFEPVAEPLRRGGSAVYRVLTHKDRPGWLPRPRAAELHLSSDPETHAIAWSFRPPNADSVGDGDHWRPTGLMAKVSRFLEHQTEPVTRNTVEGAIVGQAKFVRQAIDELVADGYVSQADGARRSKLLASVKPFTASDAVETHSDALFLERDATASLSLQDAVVETQSNASDAVAAGDAA